MSRFPIFRLRLYTSAWIESNSDASRDSARYTWWTSTPGFSKNLPASSRDERFDPGYRILVYISIDRMPSRSYLTSLCFFAIFLQM